MSELVFLWYLLLTAATMWIGVRAYGTWINHITMYGLVWGIQLSLFELKLIQYPDLSVETLFFIFGAWAIFVLAALTFRNFYGQKLTVGYRAESTNFKVLTAVLVALTLIGAIGTLQHWMILLRMFGSVKSVVINANLLYAFRRSEAGFPGMWPYIDAVSLAADFLGGYYAGLRRKPMVLGILPFVVELINAIAAFGRSRLLIGAILWGTAFFLPHLRTQKSSWESKKKTIIMVLAVLGLFVFGMEFVRMFRGVNEKFHGETSSLSNMKGLGFVTPSIYLYLSSDVAVLNKFLEYEFDGRIEHTPVGGNTFAPFYRIFAKLGLSQTVLEYQKTYAVPVSTNTASYLRELYADWGIGGALFVVYLLGASCSIAVEAYRRRRSLVLLALVGHLFVIVFFTFIVQATREGYWFVSFFFSMIGAAIVDRSSRRVDLGPNGR